MALDHLTDDRLLSWIADIESFLTRDDLRPQARETQEATLAWLESERDRRPLGTLRSF